jgi:ubiquinone biosynthesis protein COQ9
VLAFKRDAAAIEPMTLIGAWIASVDARMAAALPAATLAALPIRERIRRLVQFRLDAVAGQQEALRRALSLMALPTNATAALRLGWHSADAMWRLAGDTAADYNHYTKRATLGALYASTLAVFAYDSSEGHAETRAFLERRIADVMRFEKTKAALLRSDGERFSPARLLGRLRYPAR